MNAAEIRKIATQFKKEIEGLNPEYELWGTAEGNVPYHRKWWILKGDVVVSFLDQGCYTDGQQAGADRMRWAYSVGAKGKPLATA